ncbi:MAG: hypothetical protein CMN78_05075 [Spirochaetales bacterium]|nr:hypothetical protein [Spirochaetales bacterium]
MLERGIRHQWKALSDKIPGAPKSHAVENLKIAAGKSSGKFEGRVFQDSDLGKWIEAAAYLITVFGDPELESTVDDLASMMEEAQGEDGYLNTHFQIAEPEKRWSNLRDLHELYCAGHLIEAAVAYYHATGKKALLDVMERFADYIVSLYGPEDGKARGYPGHEEIELALVKLWKTTGRQRYLDLARFFIKERGKEPSFFIQEAIARNEEGLPAHASRGLAYFQAHAQVEDQHEAVGHSVRAMYLYSGMADVARESGDQGLVEACKVLWQSAVDRRMYVTGGVGSQSHGESFTFDHDLPNDRAYTETCAAIGLVFFAHRMLLLERDSRYSDAMERALYNGILSGMAVDGEKYLYVNPLEVRPQACEQRDDLKHVKYERQPWYPCACCPPNLARLIASLGVYLYTTADSEIAVHLYASSTTSIMINDHEVCLNQETNYPWDGLVKIHVGTSESVTFLLALRIPSWCDTWSITVDGTPADEIPVSDGYALLERQWNGAETVELKLSMPVTRIKGTSANPYAAGRCAIQRGPLVYCIEESDNGDLLHEIILPPDSTLETAPWKELHESFLALHGKGIRCRVIPPDGYPFSVTEIKKTDEKVVAIPYFAWANRSPGEMIVWIREA